MAVVVQSLSGGGITLALNDKAPMNPASTMKLVTTYAALNLLGPAYTWSTEAFADGPIEGGVLQGDLALRGAGDPKLVIEELWLLVQKIRSFGVREIRGDLVLDRSAFDVTAEDPGAFDGEMMRPYNAAPDTLLLNYKALRFNFIPDSDGKKVHVAVLPPLSGMIVPAQVRAADGPCGDWHVQLQADFSDPFAPVFRGAYPIACGERDWHVSALTSNQFFGAAFRALWEGSGGQWSGQVREGIVPALARRIAVHESAPLADVMRDINKFSNNVMARQVLLTIGYEAAHHDAPGTAERGAQAVHQWLAANQLEMPELAIENGSGRSRVEKVAAASLARLLAHAYNGPLMPEFLASLPLAGVDGTMKSRNAAVGNAHVKTGLLSNVRAIAGYVFAQSGRRYVVVSIINHPNSAAAQPAHDALLEWIYRNG